MPTIVFKVNLETVGLYSYKQPYNQYPTGSIQEGITPTTVDATNFKSTRSTWFADRVIDNHKLKNGDTFTMTGLDAMYLLNNFTSGTFKFLDVVTNTPY